MLVHKLLVLAESDRWIIVTDRMVNKRMLLDLYCYGKVATVAIPLKTKDGSMKGVVYVSFGTENNKHEDLALSGCLRYDRMHTGIRYLHRYFVENYAAGCRFGISAENFITERGYFCTVHETTFSGSSNSYGNLLFYKFDIRRLLRVWFQDLFEYTNSAISEEPTEKKSKEIKDVLVSLSEDTEYCLEFMSLEPQEVLGKCKMGENEKVIQRAFGLIS